MTLQKDIMVSYFNWADSATRAIHFHVEWVFVMAKMVAQWADSITNNIPLKRPTKWWVEG
jgi:hypothetical protein